MRGRDERVETGAQYSKDSVNRPSSAQRKGPRGNGGRALARSYDWSSGDAVRDGSFEYWRTRFHTLITSRR